MIEHGVGTGAGAAAKSAASHATAVLQYIVANDIDDTNLTIAYKYSTPDLSGAANNIFANILIL